MFAQHFPQSFLQKMGCAVVLAGTHPARLIHVERCPVAGLQHTLCHSADMAHLAAEQFYGIFYFEFSLCGGDHAVVSRLSAHGGVERRLLHKDRAHFAVRQRIHDLCLRRHHRDLRVVHQPVISHKLCCDGRIDGLIDRGVRAHIICHFAGSAGLLLLLLHAALKALFLHGEAFLLQNFLCQI